MPPAKQLWALLTKAPWPMGWKVKWGAGIRMKKLLRKKYVAGYCEGKSKTIWLNPDPYYQSYVIDTLIHEFVHLDSYRSKHTEKFRTIENGWRKRIGWKAMPYTNGKYWRVSSPMVIRVRKS